MQQLEVYYKKDVIAKLQTRATNSVITLTTENYEDMLERSVKKLNDLMFDTRQVLIRNPTTLCDVAALKVESVHSVYYAPANEADFIIPEIGLITFISQWSNMSGLRGVTDYLELKTVLNRMNRQMNLDYDWNLFPPDADGHHYLQLRHEYPMIILTYLPRLVDTDASWKLYANEYNFIFEYAWALINQFNSEQLLSAGVLGVAKEANNLVTYWERRTNAIVKEFTDTIAIEGLL